MNQYPIERPIPFVTTELLLEDKLCNVFAVMDDDTRPHGLELCSIDETMLCNYQIASLPLNLLGSIQGQLNGSLMS